MSARSATLHEAVILHRNHTFRDFVERMVEIFKASGPTWDVRIDAWRREVDASASLEDRDRALLLDLATHVFDG